MKVVELYGLRKVKGEVGIEIEMEGRRLFPDHRINNWVVKEDGSLRGENAEYVLRHPVSRDKVQEALDTLRHDLINSGAELQPSDRCGVHIHVNCQTMTIKQVLNFVTLYLCMEDVLTKWCGDNREGNLFCLRTKDAGFLLAELAKAKRMLDLRHIGGNFRYAGVNLTSIPKYGSLEFRSLETPEDFKRIKMWADMLLRIKDKSLEHEEASDFVEGFSHNGAERFLEGVLGEHLAAQLKFNNFDEMMVDSMRRAQVIAYTPIDERAMERQQALRGQVAGLERIVMEAPEPVPVRRRRMPAPPNHPIYRVGDMVDNNGAVNAIHAGFRLREIPVPPGGRRTWQIVQGPVMEQERGMAAAHRVLDAMHQIDDEDDDILDDDDIEEDEEEDW